MGLWDKAKGFLNVDGVKVRITKVENPFPADDSAMLDKMVLSAKSDKTILSTTVEFFMEETTGEGDEKRTTRHSLGSQSSKGCISEVEYPFVLKAGETREIDFFMINVNIEGLSGRLSQKGGLLGALGTAAKFAGSLNKGICHYYVEAQADVQGTPFDPTDKVEIQVVPGKS
jgi:hypothetical protein